MFDAFRFDGKRALVVGGTSGMGGALCELALDAGADVVIMDIVERDLPGAQFIRVDLARRESIDVALDACGGAVHALFCCAGVADGTPDIEKVNFIGHRYLIDQLLASGKLGRGGAIGFISSAAGLGWESNLAQISDYLDQTAWDDAVAWIAEHGKADYLTSKQAICAYVAREARAMLSRGIRINAICPGPTDTPLARANRDMWLGFGADYRADVGVDVATPLEQAYPLLFLCSDAAAALNGEIVITDSGYMSSGITGSFPPASPIAKHMVGRP